MGAREGRNAREGQGHPTGHTEPLQHVLAFVGALLPVLKCASALLCVESMQPNGCQLMQLQPLNLFNFFIHKQAVHNCTCSLTLRLMYVESPDHRLTPMGVSRCPDLAWIQASQATTLAFDFGRMTTQNNVALAPK